MLITILIYVIVIGLIWYLVTMLPLPAPFGIVAQVVVVLIAIYLLLSLLGAVPGFSHGRMF